MELLTCANCGVNFSEGQATDSGQLMQFNGVFYDLCGHCFHELERVIEPPTEIDKVVDLNEYMWAKRVLKDDEKFKDSFKDDE